MDETVNAVCRWIAGWVPYAPLQSPQYTFLHRAFVGMLLIGPLCAAIGIQVVNFRLAFFSEAIGHSAFTGLALGLVLALPQLFDGLNPVYAMIGFGVLVAIAITFVRRETSLSSDTVIGVFSSTVMAIGICVIVYLINTNARVDRATFNAFLTGNILTMTPTDVAVLAGFTAASLAIQFFTYNRLLFLGINSDLAQTMGIRVRALEYGFAVLLAVAVMLSIPAIGVLLMTAVLVIPAAAARNLAHSAGQLFWWALVVSSSSAVGGLILSDRFNTAVGATTVLLTTAWFFYSSLHGWLRGWM